MWTDKSMGTQGLTIDQEALSSRLPAFNQKKGLELPNTSAELPKTLAFAEPWEGNWGWEELGEAISSVKCGYWENTA